MGDVVTIRELSKVYYSCKRGQDSAVVAIDSFSLDVEPGDFLCIVGPSGCGKSTLLRILAGLDVPTAGSVEVLGDRRPAMVFQEPSLFPWMSLEENVAYPLRIAGMKRKQRLQRVRPLLEMTGLEDFRHCHPYELSGGMKQRGAVARALADETDLLLMDEPFGALDEQTRLHLQQELLNVWSQTSKTVLFITHSVDEAIAVGDRVLVMTARPGRVLKIVDVPFGRPRDVLAMRRDPLWGELSYQIWSLLGVTGDDGDACGCGDEAT